MKRIFITTNWIQLISVLKVVNGVNYNFKGIDNLYKSNENPVLFYSVANKIFQPQLLIDADIILIHDSSYTDVIRQFGIDQETDYLLHHSEPDGCTYDEFSKNKRTKGQHERHDNKYPKVFNIIFDGENNKAQRIIDYLFPPENNILEAKLNLLHQCLTPDELNKVTWDEDGTIRINNNKLSTIIEDNRAKNKFEELKKKNDGPFGTDYIKALEDLRNALLLD